MGGTVVIDCELCGEPFDYLPFAGEPRICDECKENTCEKCGGEGSQVMIGDEYIWKCGDCGYTDGSR